MHAVWRCRCALALGYKHADQADFLGHLRSLVEDPWLVGSPPEQSKQDRRRARMTPPAEMPGWLIYNSDGASRKQPRGENLGSCGSVLQIDDHIVAQAGIFLGDVTNNIAEYKGALESIRHACMLRQPRVCFCFDSFLVTRQLQGKWACKAAALVPLYLSALDHLDALRLAPLCIEFRLEHVYREYNGASDTLANRAIDERRRGVQSGSIVIDEAWSTISSQHVSRFRRDEEGDIQMISP